jgi:DNA polymerase III delta prime subunit
MHAFLIIGSDAETIWKECASRINVWKISAWDVIRIPEEGTVGIEMIRDFERELALTPRNSPAKAGLLTDIDRLTTEAQNALLKTLEEPPPHTYIIGTTRIPEALLPTILSRMSVVRLTDVTQKSDTSILLKLLRESPGQRISLIEPFIATRDDAKKFVTSLLGAAQEELLHHPTPQLTALIRNLLAAQSQLSVNVNQKLVIDNAVLHLT